VAEFAYEPDPEIALAPGETVREISGRSPWRIAGRRLARNRIAVAALFLFLLIVVVSFLAGFSERWAQDTLTTALPQNNPQPPGTSAAGHTPVA